jgi:hypothetical protein
MREVAGQMLGRRVQLDIEWRKVVDIFGRDSQPPPRGIFQIPKSIEARVRWLVTANVDFDAIVVPWVFSHLPR